MTSASQLAEHDKTPEVPLRRVFDALGNLAPVADAKVQSGDYACFYDALEIARTYVEGGQPGDQQERALKLMHGVIANHEERQGAARGAHGEFAAQEEQEDYEPQDQFAAAYEVMEDAIFQEGIGKSRPERIWQLIDLLSDSSQRGTQEDLQPVLLRELAAKINNEVELEDFDDGGDAGDGVHLLRIKSLGQLAAYIDDDESTRGRKLVEAQLGRYVRIGSPLLELCAWSTIDNVNLHRALKDTDGSPAALSEELQKKYAAQQEYDAHFKVLSADKERAYIQVARDAAVGLGIGDTVESFGGLDTPGVKKSYEHTSYASLYEPYILGRIMSETHIDPLSLDLKTQYRLFDFMMQSDKSRYERFVAASGGLDEDSRVCFAEAFLTAEFGDDIGNTLLSIVEHSEPDRSAEVFTIIVEYRELAKQFGSFYEAHDPELAHATERAMNERLSDILAAIEVIAREGRLDEDVAPHRKTEGYVSDGKFQIKINSLDEAIEIMRGLKASLQQITTIVPSPEATVSRVVLNQDETGYQIYRFSHPDKGDVLLHVRAQGAGAYDKAFEYGNYDGVEATISFVTSPETDTHLSSTKDPRGVSIRFDREGRTVDEDPAAEERTPIREDGLLSLDISSLIGRSDMLPVKIGRLVAAGNSIRARREHLHDSLHHNTNYFDQARFGSTEGFKGITDYIIAMTEAKISLQGARRRLGRQGLQRAQGSQGVQQAAA